MNTLLAVILLAACVAAGSTNDFKDSLCLNSDESFIDCVFIKSISALDRASKSNDIEIANGVTFLRDVPMERTGRSSQKSESEILNELPRDMTDRTIKLFSMLYDSTVAFFKSHSLKLNMPEGSVSRSLGEGRAKIKKMILPLIAAAGFKIFALVPILLGGLGLLALKALFFGKIALLVAGIIAFQKLFGGSNVSGSFLNKNPASFFYDAASGSGNWPAAGSAGYHQGYSRNLDTADAKVDAHNLAYSAHAPVASTN
ncbi:uncharacterized protein Osi14 [Anoplolepis gracilipes]|uniref:uncharacterized protein Osi14 n=1 Tax=Anoplolepis gracilipes TaxID=354296 RepID=UPI003BA016CE